MKGKNLAFENLMQFTENDRRSIISNCVFLSHRSVDKEKVKKIGEYIVNAGMNIYLDENDITLQSAVAIDDAKKITSCIQKGISSSSKLLCIVSNSTFKNDSWWVPYEIGYADKTNMQIGIMKLADILSYDIPPYLKVKQVIESVTDLNTFVESIAKNKIERSASLDSYNNNIRFYTRDLLFNESFNHPLKGVLK